MTLNHDVPPDGPTDAQIILIGEAPACFTEDANVEVLTSKGWKHFTDCTTETEVAQYEKKDATITFVKPLQIISEFYNGSVIQLKGYIDTKVTPNHRFLLYNRYHRKHLEEKAQELRLKYPEQAFITSGEKKGGLSLPANLLRLMVAVQADGSYEGYQIRFDFAKKRKAQRLLSILMSLNVKYKVGNKNKRRTFRFSISEEEEAAYQFIKTLIPDKVFDWNLLQLDKESLYVILDELEFWDGHRDKRSNRTSFEYSSAIQQNIDVVQAISHLCLHRVHFKKHVGTIRANISMHNKVQVTSIKASVENYRGKVYCLTVPSGFFLVKSNDKIFITGNSEEYHKGKSFVGSAGKHLNKLLNNAGLHRGSLYLTNVSKEKAPGNKMSNMPFDQLQLWKADLIDEINLLPNPKILVPLGNYALEAVTGRSGITNLRGSVLHPTSRIKHDCIVIPTFHPSKLHYDYTAWPLIVADFMRIKKIADSGFDFQFPAYSFILKPTFNQVMATLEKLESMNDTLMTIDVETPHRLLSCFSIAWSRSEAICIPFFWGTGKDYWSKAEEVVVWRRLSEVLPKLSLTNQNVLFDWGILLQHGIKLKIPKFDSLLMHSCLYSELPHRLEIITSIYTDVEFYKRDEKEEKGSSLKAGQEMAHWRYCCYDSVAALWSIEELLKELVEEDMIDPYLNLFADLIEPIFLMNITGIRTDSEKLKSVRKDLRENIKTVDAEIERAVGHELNVKSPKQVAHALFDELNMVGYKSRQTGKTTTSEKDLIKLAHKYQIDLPLLIVKNRKDYKLLSLFSEENIDDDGRIRCQYSLTRTKTGRIASKKSFSGRGMNLQNVKREGPARSFFVPEKGHVLIGADQKNAEARVMAWLSRDEALLEVFASGKSIHMENAKNLFGKYVDKNDPLYTVGKGLLFGANYGIGPWAFARNANLPYPEAKLKLALYYSTYPNIKDVFWKYVEEQLKESRTLYNPFGRRQIFFDRLNDNTLRAGYAFIPQSTVTDINKIALKRIYKIYLPVLEVHDGLILSVPKNEIKKGIKALQEAYNVEFEIWGEKHIIPVDVSIGDNWHDMKGIE